MFFPEKVFTLFCRSGPARLIHHYLSFFITLDGEKLSADFDIVNEVQFKLLSNISLCFKGLIVNERIYLVRTVEKERKFETRLVHNKMCQSKV